MVQQIYPRDYFARNQTYVQPPVQEAAQAVVQKPDNMPMYVLIGFFALIFGTVVVLAYLKTKKG
jgi:hypothetical protein